MEESINKASINDSSHRTNLAEFKSVLLLLREVQPHKIYRTWGVLSPLSMASDQGPFVLTTGFLLLPLIYNGSPYSANSLWLADLAVPSQGKGPFSLALVNISPVPNAPPLLSSAFLPFSLGVPVSVGFG